MVCVWSSIGIAATPLRRHAWFTASLAALTLPILADLATPAARIRCVVRCQHSPIHPPRPTDRPCEPPPWVVPGVALHSKHAALIAAGEYPKALRYRLTRHTVEHSKLLDAQASFDAPSRARADTQCTPMRCIVEARQCEGIIEFNAGSTPRDDIELPARSCC